MIVKGVGESQGGWDQRGDLGFRILPVRVYVPEPTHQTVDLKFSFRSRSRQYISSWPTRVVDLGGSSTCSMTDV